MAASCFTRLVTMRTALLQGAPQPCSAPEQPQHAVGGPLHLKAAQEEQQELQRVAVVQRHRPQRPARRVTCGDTKVFPSTAIVTSLSDKV